MKRWRVLVLFVLTLPMVACVSTGSRSWGADTHLPHWQDLRAAAVDVARSPRVWVPLAGAAVFQIDGWDRKVSDWARDNTPIFGSQQAADDWSDYLRTASSVAYFSTVLTTPGPDEVGPWIRDKSKGLAVQLGAVGVAGLATSTLKSVTNRTRPNGEGTNSFPSGHASHSAVLTGLARDNLDAIDLSPATRRALVVGLDALTYGTAWARVEAGAHFPSDTLVSIALGNFVSGVFDRAFFGPEPSQLSFAFEPMPRGYALNFEWRY